MQDLYMWKQMKNGKIRVYHSVPQAVTAWRGTNDKVTTLRDDNHQILNFNSVDEAKLYVKEKLNRSVYEWSDK